MSEQNAVATPQTTGASKPSSQNATPPMKPCTAATSSPAPTLAMTRSRVSFIRRSRSFSGSGSKPRIWTADRVAVAQQEVEREEHHEEAPEHGQHIGDDAARSRCKDRKDALHAFLEEHHWIFRQRERHPAAQHLPYALDLRWRRQRRRCTYSMTCGTSRASTDTSSTAGATMRTPASSVVRSAARLGPKRPANSQLHAIEHHREHRRPGERRQKRAEHLEGQIPDEENEHIEEEYRERFLAVSAMTVGARALYVGQNFAGDNISVVIHPQRTKARMAGYPAMMADFHRHLVEQSPDGILSAKTASLMFANPAAARLCGAAAPDEIVGRPVLDFFSQGDTRGSERCAGHSTARPSRRTKSRSAGRVAAVATSRLRRHAPRRSTTRIRAGSGHRVHDA